jgi:hypothetical protein
MVTLGLDRVVQTDPIQPAPWAGRKPEDEPPDGRTPILTDSSRSVRDRLGPSERSVLAPDPADGIHFPGSTPDVGGLGPPLQSRDHTGFHQFKAIEEGGDLLRAAEVVGAGRGGWTTWQSRTAGSSPAIWDG